MKSDHDFGEDVVVLLKVEGVVRALEGDEALAIDVRRVREALRPIDAHAAQSEFFASAVSCLGASTEVTQQFSKTSLLADRFVEVDVSLVLQELVHGVGSRFSPRRDDQQLSHLHAERYRLDFCEKPALPTRRRAPPSVEVAVESGK